MANLTNNRERLAAHLLQWHGGGGTSTYALGSYWFANKPHSYNVGLACIAELRKLLALMDDNLSLYHHASKSERRELTELIAKVERQVFKDQGAVIMTVKQLRKALRGKNGRMCVYLCVQGVPYIPTAAAFHEDSNDIFLIIPDQERFDEELGLDKA